MAVGNGVTDEGMPALANEALYLYKIGIARLVSFLLGVALAFLIHHRIWPQSAPKATLSAASASHSVAPNVGPRSHSWPLPLSEIGDLGIGSVVEHCAVSRSLSILLRSGATSQTQWEAIVDSCSKGEATEVCVAQCCRLVSDTVPWIFARCPWHCPVVLPTLGFVCGLYMLLVWFS